MGRPIICLDFDGVIHSYTSGWQGVGVVSDPPVPGAIQFIERLQDDGFTVAIYSSRSSSLRGRWAMKRWLERYVFEILHGTYADDLLCAIKWPWFKPSSFVTIDDRAITFTGTFPDVQTLKAFQPWNKLKKSNPTSATSMKGKP